MAYRKSKGKLMRRKKREPAVLQIPLLIPSGESYVDLALCASIMNRRGYKQQETNYAVAEFELLGGPTTTGTVSILKLPETWVYKNAYKKALALWNEMNDQVLDREDNIQGTYHDFKIYMDEAHVSQIVQCTADITGRILTPYGPGPSWTVANFTGAGVAPLADWNYSQVTLPNDPVDGTTTSYYLHAVGPDAAGSKGLIQGYAQSRSRVTSPDPNVPTQEGWMNQIFDDGNQLDELREIIQDDNDRVPYATAGLASSGNFYPGGATEQPHLQVHSFCEFTATTVSSKNRIQGGMFQNGLMKIVNQSDTDVAMIIHMMPGDHRGYMCEEM